MASLTGTLKVIFDFTNLATSDLSTLKDTLLHEIRLALTSGTSANQIDKIWHDRRTLAGGANETLDLIGSLTDAFGVTASFAKVKAILIYNRTTTTGVFLLVGGAASNAWAGGMLVDASDKAKVGPGGFLAWASPVDGYAAAAGSTDNLKIENGHGSTAAEYDIIIIGTSA